MKRIKYIIALFVGLLFCSYSGCGDSLDPLFLFYNHSDEDVTVLVGDWIEGEGFPEKSYAFEHVRSGEHCRLLPGMSRDRFFKTYGPAKVYVFRYEDNDKPEILWYHQYTQGESIKCDWTISYPPRKQINALHI